MRFLAAVVLLCLSFAASAQSVPGKLDLTWTPPTTGCTVGITPCDNAPLGAANALTGINVYVSTSPIPDSFTGPPTLTLGGSASAATHTMQVANGATLYVRLRAINAGGSSGLSSQVSKLISLAVLPNVPTNVTITLTIG